MASKYEVTFQRVYSYRHSELANEMLNFFGIEELPEDEEELSKFAEMAAREKLDEEIFMQDINSEDFDVDVYSDDE